MSVQPQTQNAEAKTQEEKPTKIYECPVCHEKFTKMGQYVAHVRHKHGKIRKTEPLEVKQAEKVEEKKETQKETHEETQKKGLNLTWRLMLYFGAGVILVYVIYLLIKRWWLRRNEPSGRI